MKAADSRDAMTGDLLRGNRSAALTAHDVALDGLVALLEGAGLTVGDWRPLVDELRATAQEIEADADLAHERLDDVPETWGATYADGMTTTGGIT